MITDLIDFHHNYFLFVSLLEVNYSPFREGRPSVTLCDRGRGGGGGGRLSVT